MNFQPQASTNATDATQSSTNSAVAPTTYPHQPNNGQYIPLQGQPSNGFGMVNSTVANNNLNNNNQANPAAFNPFGAAAGWNMPTAGGTMQFPFGMFYPPQISGAQSAAVPESASSTGDPSAVQRAGSAQKQQQPQNPFGGAMMNFGMLPPDAATFMNQFMTMPGMMPSVQPASNSFTAPFSLPFAAPAASDNPSTSDIRVMPQLQLSSPAVSQTGLLSAVCTPISAASMNPIPWVFPPSFRVPTTTQVALPKLAPLTCSVPTPPWSNVSSPGSKRETTETEKAGQLKRVRIDESKEDDPAKGKDDEEVEPVKKRLERNVREQHRSQKITNQIKELRQILSHSKIIYKPTKYSILKSAAEYIEALQMHMKKISDENTSLQQAIAYATQVANTGIDPLSNHFNLNPHPQAHSTTTGETKVPAAALCNTGTGIDTKDYKAVFEQCRNPFAIYALDGTFVECNTFFELVTKYPKQEIQQQSLFHFMRNDDMSHIFKAMGQMLKEANKEAQPKRPEDDSIPDSTENSTFWTGIVYPHQDTPDEFQLLMNITLTRSSQGNPLFLNVSLSAVDVNLIS